LLLHPRSHQQHLLPRPKLLQKPLWVLQMRRFLRLLKRQPLRSLWLRPKQQ